MAQRRVVRERRHHLAARGKGPEGHTPAQSLRKADYVGRDAVLGHGEHLARAAHAGLYLVEYEHRPHLVTTAPQSLEVTLLRRPHSRLALHRLAQHARRAARDLPQILHTVETYGPRIGQQRTERPLPLLALGRAHHAHGTVRRAVVGTPHGDHLRTARISFCEFQRPLDRLGTRVDEVDAVYGGGHRRHKPRGILHLRPLDKLAVDHNVHVVGRLPLHGPYHIGIAVTHVANRHTRHKVIISLSLGRVEEDTLGTRHLHHHGRGRGLRHVRKKLSSQYIAHPPYYFILRIIISGIILHARTPRRNGVRVFAARRAPTTSPNGTSPHCTRPPRASTPHPTAACAARACISILRPRPRR